MLHSSGKQCSDADEQVRQENYETPQLLTQLSVEEMSTWGFAPSHIRAICEHQTSTTAADQMCTAGLRSQDPVVVQHADWIFSKRTLSHWTRDKLCEFNHRHLGQRDWEQCTLEELREVTITCLRCYPCYANVLCFAVKTMTSHNCLSSI